MSLFAYRNGFRAALAMGIIGVAVCVSGGPAYGAGVQVSLSSCFNADDVLRDNGGTFTAPGISFDNPAPGGSVDNWMLTQSAANALAVSQSLPTPAPLGISDNGLYAATGARLYDVQLGFTNTAATGTNVVCRFNTNGNFSFNVPSNYYQQFAIIASGGSGTTPLTITLNYAAGSAGTVTATLPDWYSAGTITTAAGAAGTIYELTGPMSRQAAYGAGCPSACTSGYQTPNVSSNGAYIYGVNLAPDSTRQLTSVNVAYAAQGISETPYTVANFFTAAGSLATPPSTQPSVPALSVWALALLAAGLGLGGWYSMRRRHEAL